MRLLLAVILLCVASVSRAQPILDDEALRALRNADDVWQICPNGECRPSRVEASDGTVLIWVRNDGRWDNRDAQTRQWLRSQTSPKNGMSCCDEADGVEAEEDIRDGHYWARWKMKPRGYEEEFTTEWTQVPDDVVIKDPNRNGAPVVWWWFENGKPAVRCFAPGGGV